MQLARSLVSGLYTSMFAARSNSLKNMHKRAQRHNKQVKLQFKLYYTKFHKTYIISKIHLKLDDSYCESTSTCTGRRHLQFCTDETAGRS